jgi:2-keto-4-pentenoate hydratase/2-oxohepta-3-ene-1,7-dioic acid hydratase in catechol pathway
MHRFELCKHAKELERISLLSPSFHEINYFLSGPFDPIIIPKNSVKTDWEVELAVVIGKKASMSVNKMQCNTSQDMCYTMM